MFYWNSTLVYDSSDLLKIHMISKWPKCQICVRSYTASYCHICKWTCENSGNHNNFSFKVRNPWMDIEREAYIWRRETTHSSIYGDDRNDNRIQWSKRLQICLCGKRLQSNCYLILIKFNKGKASIISLASIFFNPPGDLSTIMITKLVVYRLEYLKNNPSVNQIEINIGYDTEGETMWMWSR